MHEQEQKKPNLNPNLKIYEEGIFKTTDKELGKKIKENQQKKITEKGRKKVEDAVIKGELKFGTKSEKVRKPTFEEYKAKQKTEQEEMLEKAREKLKEKYEEAKAA
ncbi:hypothetical protein KKH07_01325 [Patescibacteria group bacterium]|nr:hypothetical protein [Patescibacteria group bacterium]MBU1563735.1 hypothetical protein [Patescibacteria group bacterium]MBU2068278.1 hypothetical protein [Patescibacteria group bacterium]